ncbi:efflux RND transporter periplasmic adaptor subunit [Hansschlegelia quercus]|uniref:Efflux RND transporter periplasmic adaptor subunit n=1 Tax=Hansschlegelia quercus TaxID=2528245 RepID=A0A4Q9GMN3_9HYPH|nr:efflux RND transporter periplasmic adaptor subunit [Hansschlegelia quercus]TBN52453.1 efflux RND transporter periplasmic adaptor subunit [Hansschlegelia quercus]
MAGRTIFVLVLAALAGGGYVAWRSYGHADAAPQHAAAAPAKPVPVQTVAARRADVPVSLTGLATVQPLTVVTVRSRIDGEVLKVGFAEGQMVAEGDLLAQIDPRPYQASLDQAKAKQAQDEAQLANALRDLARSERLVESNFTSRQQVDGQRATVAQLRAQIEGDKAAVESAQVQLDYTTIRAPMAGRAGFHLVDRGNLVRATDATGIVTLSQIQPITAVVTLPERDFLEVADAMKRGPVKAVALAPDGRELATGELDVLNSQIDQQTGTFRAKAKFANADSRLWPGQSVSVRAFVNTLQNVVTVPEDAVQRGPDGYFAFVVKTDATAEKRGLTVGRQAEGVAVIQRGLDDGDEVVAVGASRVTQGAHLEARPVSGVAQASRRSGESVTQ